MIHRDSRTGVIIQHWRAQDGLSRWVVALSLLLIVFAFVPTLRSDFVAPDQWRAFRYSILPQTAYERAKACANTIPPYYSRTGRPLVWLSECAEHAAVARISDFVYLRPLVLAIVLFTALYLGTVLAPLAGGFPMGVIAASAFVMAPGYSFMYLQGMTGAMVLIAILLAAASFALLRHRLTRTAEVRIPDPAGLLAPFGLFFVACLIYPAWAFLVVGLTLIALAVDIRASRTAMLKRFCACLLFYCVAAVFYYAFERVIEAIQQAMTGFELEEPGYSMTMQLSPGILIERTLEAARRFYEMPPLNFAAPRGCLLAALGLFSGYIGWQDWRTRNRSLSAGVAAAAFFLGCIALLGSVSPWLFSRMDQLATRHLAPWYLFFCVCAVGLIQITAKALPARLQKLSIALALIVFLAPVAVMQYRLSSLETAVSGLEIESLRTNLAQWLDRRGYENQRYLLAVRPPVLRPAIAQSVGAEAGDNAILSSAANWVQISWMVNALLRERSDHPMGRSVNLLDCVLDQGCVEQTLREPHAVALAVAYGAVIRTSEPPYLINFSLLTAQPAVPRIELVNRPANQSDSAHPK